MKNGLKTFHPSGRIDGSLIYLLVKPWEDGVV